MATTHSRPVNPRVEYYSKPASTAIAYMDAVSPDASGTANQFALTTSSSEEIYGFCLKTVVSTDSDYASETKVPVLVDEDGEFTFDTTGADANDEGNIVDFADEDSLDLAASTIKHVLITSYVSSTRVVGKVRTWASRPTRFA